MSAYTSGDSIYFNNMTDNTKKHHIGFLLNQRHDIYIKSLLNIMDQNFVSLPKLFVNKMLIKWINANIQIVAQLSKVNVRNKHNQQMEEIYNERDILTNIFSYVGFWSYLSCY